MLRWCYFYYSIQIQLMQCHAIRQSAACVCKAEFFVFVFMYCKQKQQCQLSNVCALSIEATFIFCIFVYICICKECHLPFCVCPGCWPFIRFVYLYFVYLWICIVLYFHYSVRLMCVFACVVELSLVLEATVIGVFASVHLCFFIFVKFVKTMSAVLCVCVWLSMAWASRPLSNRTDCPSPPKPSTVGKMK